MKKSKIDLLIDRASDALDAISRIDARRILFGIGGVVTIATIHFVSYLFFAISTIPPQIDVVSFSNFIIPVGAIAAVSSLFSRIVFIPFFEFGVRIFHLLSIGKLAVRHVLLRQGRRATNGFVFDEFVGRHPISARRRATYITKLAESSSDRWRNRFGGYMMVSFSVLIFSYLYNGLMVTLIVGTYLSVIFLFLFIFFSVFEFLKAVGRAMNPVEVTIDSSMVERLQVGNWAIPSAGHLKLEITAGIFASGRRFASEYAVLFVIVSAALFGMGRAAYILDGENYNAKYSAGGSELFSEEIEIFATNSNGILALRSNARSRDFIFVSYDTGLTTRLVPGSSGNYHKERLVRWLSLSSL